MMLIYVSGIFFTQMVGRSDAYRTQAEIYGEGVEPTFSDYHPGYDMFQHYGTIVRAMFTLFETSLDPMNLRPIIEAHTYVFVIEITFIFMTTFGVMNVIIGVIVDNTMSA